MNEERTDVTRNRAILLAVGAVAFVILIIAISVVVSVLSDDDSGVTFANESNVTKSEDTSIEKHDYKLIKKQLRAVLTNRYNLPENEEINALIRESTYQESGDDGEKTITFTLDVENVKVTYYVWMIQTSEEASEVSLSCAPAKDSKYPETFCIGTEGHSSIDANMSSQLPYRYIVNGEEKYKISHEPYEPYLILSIRAKCDDNEAVNVAKNNVREWISSFGLNPDQVPVEIDKTACEAYEDEMIEGQHGSHTQEDMMNHL